MKIDVFRTFVGTATSLTDLADIFERASAGPALLLESRDLLLDAETIDRLEGERVRAEEIAKRKRERGW